MSACAECVHYKRAYGYAAEDLRDARRKVRRASDETLEALAVRVREAKAQVARATEDLNEHVAGCETARAKAAEDTAATKSKPPPQPKGPSHRRKSLVYAVRYTPGTSLARRYPGIPTARFKSAEEAERIRAACINAEHMEVIDVRDAP